MFGMAGVSWKNLSTFVFDLKDYGQPPLIIPRSPDLHVSGFYFFSSGVLLVGCSALLSFCICGVSRIDG